MALAEHQGDLYQALQYLCCSHCPSSKASARQCQFLQNKKAPLDAHICEVKAEHMNAFQKPKY